MDEQSTGRPYPVREGRVLVSLRVRHERWGIAGDRKTHDSNVDGDSVCVRHHCVVLILCRPTRQFETLVFLIHHDTYMLAECLQSTIKTTELRLATAPSVCLCLAAPFPPEHAEPLRRIPTFSLRQRWQSCRHHMSSAPQDTVLRVVSNHASLLRSPSIIFPTQSLRRRGDAYGNR